jgi:mono/diheme cytochrome c family protein
MEEFMLKNLKLTGAAAALALGVFAAGPIATSAARAADQTKARAITISVAKTAPVSGKQMYGSYCASCHGVDGKGDGPVGASLKYPPADLTVLSRNNGGKFPSAHVASVLQLGARIPSHGDAEMPVWGPVLGKMDQANSLDRPLRISNLSRYLETIQAK